MSERSIVFAADDVQQTLRGYKRRLFQPARLPQLSGLPGDESAAPEGWRYGLIDEDGTLGWRKTLADGSVVYACGAVA